MSTTTKSPRANILPVAEHLVAVLGRFCTRIELAGSLRRQTPMVGDIEIVAVPVPRLDLFGHPITASTADTQVGACAPRRRSSGTDGTLVTCPLIGAGLG